MPQEDVVVLLRGLSKGDGKGLDLDKLPWSPSRAKPVADKASTTCLNALPTH